MKRYLYIGLFAWVFLCLGCNREDRYLFSGEGTLRLDVRLDEEVTVVSRAEMGTEGEDAGTDELKDKCRIRVYEGDKLVYKHSGWDETLGSEGLSLSSGVYRVRITSGDSVAASFDKKFYEGNEEFEIKQHQTTSVEVVCNVANTLAKVCFDASLKDYLADAEVTVGVDDADGSLSYPYVPDSEEGKTGYYSLPEGKEYLICTFSGTAKNGQKFTQTDRIADAKKSVLYTLTYKKGDSSLPDPPTNEGGAYLQLTVDETPLVTREEEITIYQRPKLRALNGGEEIDMSQPWYLEQGSQISPEVSVYASTPLGSVKVESELLTRMGLSSPVELMDESVRGALQAQGIEVSVGEKTLTMKWGTSLNAYLAEEAEHHIRYTATDTGVEGESEAKTTEADWVLSVSNANVTAIDIPYVYKIWGDRATLYGKIIEGRTSSGPFYFHYRKTGESDWSDNVPAALDGDYIVSDEIKGLTPGTEYEYQIIEGEKVSNATCSFVTESVFVLDNSSFEYTSRDGNVLRISQDPNNIWWDSGNEGSAKMSKDVTTGDTSVKHSGNQSLKLQSQFVGVLGIGKFAAGNVFSGEFLGTENTYYGILGWGRPCTSRPLALRAWVRYTPGTVDYTETELISNGDTDRGIIYVAVGDWQSDDSDYGSQWPVVVRTQGPKLFDPKDKGTIGYGEVIFTDEVRGDTEAMKQVTISLDYENYGGMERIPTHIIIVASASQYGDYYSGSTGSVMWLDDLELIYEESKLNELVQ